MRSANATVRLPDGQRILCYPGDLVGRMESCKVRVADPRVSEAHAMFSLRSGLYLLFLRRMGITERGPAWHLELHPGTRVELAAGLFLEVLEVQPATEQLALALEDGPPIPLEDAKYALRPDRTPFLIAGASPDVWPAGDAYYLRTDSGVVQIEPGMAYQIGGREVRASVVTREGSWTQITPDVIRTVIRLTRRDDLRVVIEDETGRVGELNGLAAQTMYSLARAGGRLGWLQVCTDLWGAKRGAEKRSDLYKNVLHRLDRTLRGLGLRDDLIVRSDGTLSFAGGVTFEWVEPEPDSPQAATRRE